MQSAIPELADGGYWYVVATGIDEETGAAVPLLPVRTAYAAWSAAPGFFIVRLLAPVVLPPTPYLVSDFIDLPRKPRARLGGK